MAAALEAIIIVLVGLSGVAFFFSSMMTGAPTALHVFGGLGTLAVAWAWGIMRTY